MNRWLRHVSQCTTVLEHTTPGKTDHPQAEMRRLTPWNGELSHECFTPAKATLRHRSYPAAADRQGLRSDDDVKAKRG